MRDMRSLAGLVRMANRDLPPRESSGLVEMQRIFMKGCKRDG